MIRSIIYFIGIFVITIASLVVYIINKQEIFGYTVAIGVMILIMIFYNIKKELK